MRYFIIILISWGVISSAYSQRLDTLSNIPKDSGIYAPKYTANGQYGYFLGQNHLYRQQFGEKYYINGTASVVGMIAHLAGKYAHPENTVEFNVYNVANTGLPNVKLGGREYMYSELDLSGAKFNVQLFYPAIVKDSFFVTFNVFDYLHGGYEGDTLGLYMGKPGTRSDNDLLKFGRNVVQAHNHSKEDWKDFYSQNFTPIATHFALYPVIKIAENLTGISNTTLAASIKLYPNPTTDWLYVEGLGFENTYQVIDHMGKAYAIPEFEKIGAGIKLNISHLQQGNYILLISNNKTGFGMPFVKQ